MSAIKYNFAQKIRWLRLLLHSRSSKLNEDVALSILEKISRESPTVFDIGANIGLFIKAFNKSPNKPSAIFAFEPSSYVFSILTLTVARFKNVQCFKLAFDRQDSEAILNMPLKKSGSIRIGISHIGKTTEGEYLKETVQTKILDHFIEEQDIDKIDLIKIDVEGAEYNILQGADKVLNAIRPYWYVEITEKRQRFSHKREETFNIFIQAGYAAFYYDENGHWQPISAVKEDQDFLFVPSEEIEAFTKRIS